MKTAGALLVGGGTDDLRVDVVEGARVLARAGIFVR